MLGVAFFGTFSTFQGGRTFGAHKSMTGDIKYPPTVLTKFQHSLPYTCHVLAKLLLVYRRRDEYHLFFFSQIHFFIRYIIAYDKNCYGCEVSGASSRKIRFATIFIIIFQNGVSSLCCGTPSKKSVSSLDFLYFHGRFLVHDF